MLDWAVVVLHSIPCGQGLQCCSHRTPMHTVLMK